MQMPNASQQGIATLMQKPQGQAPGQQSPMPTPGKASPMAGLGSVDDRVNAYQGDTKPLEQRYKMTQDLLDLLALQKIKSQKDAAARQMQLQMAQQGQQDGQANMTVAEQRAQEVEALTKNELAQQRGDTAQKQTGDQQAMMQKMMGGVASAPGAAAAAQPKMFASGGIIGYAGPEGSVVGGDTMGTASPEQQELASQASEMAINERSKAKLIAELEQKLAFLTNAGSPKAGEVRAQLEAVRASGATSLPKAPPAAAPTARPASVSEAQATAAAGPKAVMPPAAPRPPAPPTVPRPPAPPGIAGLPGAAGPANDFGKKLEAAALKNAEIDPAARQLSEEKRITDKVALTPDQRKVYDEGIAGLQGMYKEQYDPERQRQEGIKRALIGAGGRRYGEFAGAAQAGMAYDDQQRAAKLKEFGDVQKARTGLIDIDRANVKEGIGAGQKAYEQGSLSQRQGLESGSRLYSTDVGSRDKALDRVIEKLKVDAQNAATTANRENLSFERARTLYGTLMQRVQKAESDLQENFEKGPLGTLLMQDPAKLKPEDRNRLDIAKLELERQKKAMSKELAPVLESAAKQMGISDTNLSPEDKAAIEKYTKGK
jgi:hypothetical protein